MTNYLADKLAVPTGEYLDANMGVEVSSGDNGNIITVHFGPEPLHFRASIIGQTLTIGIAKSGEPFLNLNVDIPAGDADAEVMVSGISFAGKTLTITASNGSTYDVVLPLNYDEHSFTGDGTAGSPLKVSGEAVLEQTVDFQTQEQPQIIINKTDRINETFASDSCQFGTDEDFTVLDGMLTGTIRLRLTNSTLSTLQSSRLEVISQDGSVVYGMQEVVFGGITPISIALNNIETDSLCLRWVGRDSRIFHATVDITYTDIALHSDGPLHDNVVHLANNASIQRTEPIKNQLSEANNLLNATVITQNAIKAITDDLESITITRSEPVAFVVSNDPYLTDFSSAALGARNVRTQDFVYVLGSSNRIAMSNLSGDDVGFGLEGSNGDPVYFRYRPHIAIATTLNVSHSVRIDTLQVKQDIITLRNDISALQQEVNANQRAIGDNTLLSDEREAVELLTQNLVDNDTFVNVVDGIQVLKVYNIPENSTHGEATDLAPLFSREVETESLDFDDTIERITYNGTKATDRGNLFDRLTLKKPFIDVDSSGDYWDGNYVFKLDFKPFNNHYTARQGLFTWRIYDGNALIRLEVRDKKLTLLVEGVIDGFTVETRGPIQIENELIGEKRHGITLTFSFEGQNTNACLKVSCVRHDTAGAVDVGQMTLELPLNLKNPQGVAASLNDIIIGSTLENNGEVWSDFFNPAERDRSQYPVPYTTDDGFYTRQEKVFITGTTVVFADLPQTDNDWEVGFDIADAQATIDGANCAPKMFALGNIPMDRFTLRHKVGDDALSVCKFWFKQPNLTHADLFPKPASIGLSWGYSENYSQYDYHFFVSSEDTDQFTIDHSVAGYSILTVPVNPEQARLITSIADMRTLVFKDFSVLWTPYFGNDSTMASGTLYNLGYYYISDADYDTALFDRITSESDTAFYRLAKGKALEFSAPPTTFEEGSFNTSGAIDSANRTHTGSRSWQIVGNRLTVAGKITANNSFSSGLPDPPTLSVFYGKQFKEPPVITATLCKEGGTGYITLNCDDSSTNNANDRFPTVEEFNLRLQARLDFVRDEEVHWIAIGEPAD